MLKSARALPGFAGLCRAWAAGLIVLATTSTVSAQWTGTLNWNASGNANWGDANWQLNGGGSNIAYINNTPLTFSASFNSADRTVTPLDGTTLYHGQILSHSLFQW
ncbi:MAG: hypothetical protein LBD30_03740, partial [Verrucomicrobiales bacterium]|nr:hypothetical protein [Verrucomicrobiales bacterium]